MMKAKPIREQLRIAHVLLVDDEQDHVDLIRLALEETRLPIRLQVAGDGRQALALLRREAPHVDAPRPDLLVIDINMPRMDGFELMREIGNDPLLKALPVIVLTTSANPADLRRMMELRCSSYLVKPVGFDELVTLWQLLGDYWLGLAVLPGNTQAAPPAS